MFITFILTVLILLYWRSWIFPLRPSPSTSFICDIVNGTCAPHSCHNSIYTLTPPICFQYYPHSLSNGQKIKNKANSITKTTRILQIANKTAVSSTIDHLSTFLHSELLLQIQQTLLPLEKHLVLFEAKLLYFSVELFISHLQVTAIIIHFEKVINNIRSFNFAANCFSQDASDQYCQDIKSSIFCSTCNKICAK